jgi:hypothetical protein
MAHGVGARLSGFDSAHVIPLSGGALLKLSLRFRVGSRFSRPATSLPCPGGPVFLLWHDDSVGTILARCLLSPLLAE